MSDEREESAGTRSAEPEEVGSVAEETAKLLAALQGWAREAGHEQASAASAVADGFASTFKDLGDHIGHGPDCTFCPVCRVINVVRETSPEVKASLAIAANALLQAVQGLLETHGPNSAQRRGPVEKIDLDDAGWEDEG